MNKEQKILIIQTAFIGDVILATSLVEHTRNQFPNAQIDFFLRKGNQSILETSPHITKLYIWDKSRGKIRSLIRLIKQVRSEKYDYVINIQRFFNSGLVTLLSGAKYKVGFHNNPLSFSFTHKIDHKIPFKHNDTYLHEVQRNQRLLSKMTSNFELLKDNELKPKIYFTDSDMTNVTKIKKDSGEYFVLAPASVWYTKQWHIERWKELIQKIGPMGTIYLIGAPTDHDYLSPLTLINDNVLNIAGKLSLRESALLMRDAKRVFVNDSAPLHLASSVNAKTTAIFCSTVPDFGYYPLSDNKAVIQVHPRLECMPCGLHGYKSCPLGHFKCSSEIKASDIIATI